MREPLYTAARRVLLDALEALEKQRDALVLVGAQAVYIHAAESDFAIAPYTTDADLAVDPSRLASEPELAATLASAGFILAPNAVGQWSKVTAGVDTPIDVDLLVPASLGGPGRRSATLRPHSSRAARKAEGLEGALVDNDEHEILAFEAGDQRRIRLRVAGPSALIVAKCFKLGERLGTPTRMHDKDALDVLRLLRAVPTAELARRYEKLRQDPVSADVAMAAMDKLSQLFSSPRKAGCAMANRAAGGGLDGEEAAASLSALSEELLREL